MPQGRSLAFSGKKKKEQLKNKRNQKKTRPTEKSQNSDELFDGSRGVSGRGDASPSVVNVSKSEKYKLLFQYETKESIEAAKRRAQEEVIQPSDLEKQIALDDVYDSLIDFPKRPHWAGETDPRKIDFIERKGFGDYLEKVHENYDVRELSYFEHNIETWRQLWRILEYSDLICIVADVRHPVLHFPPALYRHIRSVGKKVILILSKIDLVKPELYVAWKNYFIEKFPDLQVVGFTCFDRFTYRENKNIQKRRNRTVKFGNQFASQFGPVELGQAIENSFDGANIVRAAGLTFLTGQEILNRNISDLRKATWLETLRKINSGKAETQETSESEIPTDPNMLKIGFVGHTNVGKSSIMNTLVGEKHFSMSIRPGHTKELQTWNVHPMVQLVDSPGIIFPSKVPRQLQILSGLFPVDQVREPYSVVGYLGSRLNLVSMFQLKHVSDEREFTAWDLCESFAQKKNFMVNRKRYPDAYRGANFLLRMAVSGQVVLAFEPPGFFASEFENDEEVLSMKAVTNADQEYRRIHKYDTTHGKSQENSENDDSESDESSDDSDQNGAQVDNRFALLEEDD